MQPACDASAIVVVATVGKPTLLRTINAILTQSHAHTEVLVVIDGPAFHDHASAILRQFSTNPRVTSVTLPQNTGSCGFVCHRIYGAMPLLVNQDFIFYCDDDNWYEPRHVGSCVTMCVENDLQWCCAMRNIFNAGSFLCRDECESIGLWPVWYSPHIFHVDTNCYCLRRDVAVALAPHWHKSRVQDGRVQPSADTEVCHHLRKFFPKHALIADHSVNYELGSSALSPSPDFFQRGNEEFLRQHGGVLPWRAAINRS